MREHPIAPKPTRIRLPAVEDSHRVVRPIELEQRLDVVGSPPTPARLAPPEPRGRPLGLVEPRRGRVRVAALKRDKAERPEMHRCVKPDLLLSEPQRQL